MSESPKPSFSGPTAEFLARVSHEIRTQLSGILGMTQVVLDTKITPEQREYVEIIAASGDALLTLVNDLLDVSKMEAGRLEIEHLPFSLYDTFTDSVGSFRGTAQAKGLELRTRIGEGVPDLVLGDPGRLRQVITNLVGNAIKFTERGWIEATLTVDPDDVERVRLTVSDTGPGIPHEARERIFQPFVQASGGRNSGTGLGLAISRQIVEMMGGEIEVGGEVGSGATFSFSVRLARQLGDRVADGSGRRNAFDQLPVMIMGIPAGNFGLTAILEDLGVRTAHLADDGAVMRALIEAQAEDAPYALVVLDDHPDALEFVAEIRGRPALASLHVLVLTSSGERGDGARCRSLGVGGYLTKPVLAEDVAEAAAAILKGPMPVDLTTLVTRHWLRERRRRLSVLVVDDSPANRMFATRLLEQRGHRVTAATGGLEAIEAVDRHRFDLVLMDVWMPEMGGIQAIEAIRRAEEATRERVPIVAFANEPVSEVAELCLGAGADAMLRKPLVVHELVSIVEDLAG